MLAAMAGVFACRQIVGFDESSPSNSTVCGLPYGTSACAACVNANCCTESAACAADDRCAAYEGCLGACSGDPGCRALCLLDHPPGYTAPSSLPALGACLASKCEAPCGLACGASGSVLSTSPDAAAACQSCVAANACQAAQDCAASTECITVDQCGRGCPTLDCSESCATHHEAGAALETPLPQAFVGSCASQCGLGRDWSCVRGGVSWPIAKLNTVTMTVAVEDSPVPIPGATVSVSNYCPPLGEGGTSVLAEGSTDDAGTLTLQVPQSTTAGPGINHGLDGCLVVTAPGYLPTFWYWGFPLTEPAVVFTPTEPGAASDWVPVITSAEAAALYTVAGISAPDSSRGIVGVTILDCEGAPAPDVQIKPEPDDPGIRTLYGLSAALKASDSTALAFLVDVPPGVLTLTATPNALGKPSSVITVNVAANTFTEVLMYPTPMP